MATGTPGEVTQRTLLYRCVPRSGAARPARGRAPPADDAELDRLENENLFSLRDLAESGRVPIESAS